MEAKAPSTSLNLHAETRLNLRPSSSSAILQLQLPSTGVLSRPSRIQRRILSHLPTCRNEEEFKTRYIASSSSIYFRSARRYPRSILWRCVEDNSLLEIRSLDLSKEEGEVRDASVVLRIGFPAAIRKHGVAVADSIEEDTISVFALTSNNDLYTLSLSPAFFYKLTASEDDTDRWCKVFRPSSLSISNFYRLTACGAHVLLMTLADGRLVRLTRRQGEDGSQWNEAAYTDGQWTSSLRGLIRWQGGNTVHYDGNALDQNAALNVTLSPDESHIIAVCLNHTLKFWNLENGRPTVSRDLVDVPREPQDVPKVMLNPGILKTLAVFETRSAYDGDLYFLLTFSPHFSGVFKVWGVRDADYSEAGIRDLFPDDILRVPDPDDGALWSMCDFQVRSDPTDARFDIWILVRLNRRYKLYRRQFSELTALGSDWQDGWSATLVDPGNHEPSNEPPLKIFNLDSKGTSDKWLDFLTSPERIPEPLLETALQVYIDARQVPRSGTEKAPLKERLAVIIGSRISPEESSSEAIANFQDNLNKEWMRFWNTLVGIDHMRWDPLSLGIDSHGDMPYIVFADGCSIVRDLCEVETLARNRPRDLAGGQSSQLTNSIELDGSSIAPRSSEELSTIIDAAAKFRSGFSSTLLLSCQHALQKELWLDSSFSVSERIQAFYSQCNFEAEVGDRTYNALAVYLKSVGGFNALTTDAFRSVLGMFPKSMSKASELTSTRFGLKALVKGTQDMAALQLRVLADLLYLLVFADIEVDREEFGMENLDSSLVFSELLGQLRQSQLAHWLGTHSRSVAGDLRQNAPGSAGSKAAEGYQCTILEDLFARDIKPQAYVSQGQSFAFTQTIRDLLTWVSGGNEITLDKVLVTIQCDLLRNQNIVLASSFARFQPSTAWATYVKGRLSLERHEYTEAAHCFKKAAFSISRPIPESSEYAFASSSLLDPVTASSLASGLPSYYTHIITLLSPHRAHAHIASFAQLALQHCSPTTSTPAQRSDLLSRLFHASLAIADYPTAYSALTRQPDRALQKSALTSLITSMVASSYVDELLSLPFPDSLQKDVDGILAEHTRREIDLPPSALASVPYFKILHAFRLRRGNYRAAAAVLVERLEARHERKEALSLARFGAGGKEQEKVMDEYLVGINALALLRGEDEEEGGPDDEAWVFVEGLERGGGGAAKEGRKRRVMRLEGLRERYQGEMDRVEVLEMGRWGIVGGLGEEMEM